MKRLVLPYAVIAVLAAGCTVTTKQASVPQIEPVIEDSAPDLAKTEPVEMIEHLGVGAVVEVSSIQQEWEGEGPPASLVDGDPGTRWSSIYEDGQEVMIDLGREMPVAAVRLLWETASAKRYAVAVSSDGMIWNITEEITDGLMGPRTDEIYLGGDSVRFIRLDLLERATEWGFSLYEIEVIAPK